MARLKELGLEAEVFRGVDGYTLSAREQFLACCRFFGHEVKLT